MPLRDGVIKHYKKLSSIISAMLAVLVLIFYIVTVFLNMQMYNQVINIQQQPFPVMAAVGDVKAASAQMRMLSERLGYLQTEEVIERVSQHYEKIEEECTSSVQTIVDRYLTNPSDAERLQKIFAEVMEQQRELLELCRQPNVTGEDISGFVSENITIRLNEMDVILESITDHASNEFDSFVDLIWNYRSILFMLATILLFGVFAALAVYLFILRKKELEEEKTQKDMEVALAAAQAANAAKSQFLSNMSHDIRTPMNAIIGMAAIANTKLDDKEQVRDCLSKIDTSSKHLLGLINDVLDMSKIESGKVIIKEESFNLPDLIQGIVTIIQPQVKAKSLSFEVSIDNVEDEQLVGDTLRIQQVLINLLGNAVKFTPTGGRIDLKLAQDPSFYPGYGNYKFVVSDNGIGMTEEFLSHIFEPFERAKTSTVSRTEGTGLGMAITKNIVDIMGGQIYVESRPGEGTDCTVQLHLRVQYGGGEEKEIQTATFQGLRAEHNGKALVVEDNELNAEIAEEMLKLIGMNVQIAGDGQQATELMEHGPEGEFDIIFMDVQMPIMDGYQATREIRRLEQDSGRTPMAIVGMSANAFAEDIEKAREAGMDDYIIKPISQEELLRVLDKYLKS